MPSCLLPEGSKEGFVSLLEYTEETLGLTNIVVCLRKDRDDRGTTTTRHLIKSQLKSTNSLHLLRNDDNNDVFVDDSDDGSVDDPDYFAISLLARANQIISRTPLAIFNKQLTTPSSSFDSTSSSTNLAMLVRTFMFLGFSVLPPGHQLIPPGSDKGNLYMLYAIE